MSDLMGRIATAVWGEAGDRHSITILETVFAELDLAGYAIVPKEATDEMIEAGWSDGRAGSLWETYRRMLAAAPKVAE
jgi:hypothetical protein